MKMDIFTEGKGIDLMSALENKDWRAEQLTQLGKKNPEAILLSVKLNIPGPIKNNQYFKKLFLAGQEEILQITQLKRLNLVYLDRETGPEAFFLAENSSLETIKRQTIQFEENFPLGRYFDLDVYEAGQFNKQISRTDLGFPKRKCFVCERPAKECARAQRHTKEEIKSVINQKYEDYFGK